MKHTSCLPWRTASGISCDGLVLPPRVKHSTLTTMREKLIKIGAKVVRHSKYVFFQMAAVAVSRKLFAAILERIQRLRAVPGMAPS